MQLFFKIIHFRLKVLFCHTVHFCILLFGVFKKFVFVLLTVSLCCVASTPHLYGFPHCFVFDFFFFLSQGPKPVSLTEVRMKTVILNVTQTEIAGTITM